MEVIGWIAAVGILIVLLAFLLIRRPTALATGRVVAGSGIVEASLVGATDCSIAIALSLCYAAKIRWLTLSEDQIVQTILHKVYERTLEDWPEIPQVEMIASLSEIPSVYSVELLHDPKGAGWFVSNNIPSLIRHRGDIVTHYFFLLKEIGRKLSEIEMEYLGEALRSFSDVMFAPESEVTGLKGLSYLNLHANRLVGKYTQGC